ncbi:hypothetical protein CLF_102474 [Clonorchis sinensis]|uniref:Uncharacterized protein n=1 Tax=Clonorchis sinensis TaxID=79923 RepID=G7Y808_CLOSI|nr:hypothetical protein CLF_102474 [Clonorchis sinensis]
MPDLSEVTRANNADLRRLTSRPEDNTDEIEPKTAKTGKKQYFYPGHMEDGIYGRRYDKCTSVGPKPTHSTVTHDVSWLLAVVKASCFRWTTTANRELEKWFWLAIWRFAQYRILYKMRCSEPDIREIGTFGYGRFSDASSYSHLDHVTNFFKDDPTDTLAAPRCKVDTEVVYNGKSSSTLQLTHAAAYSEQGDSTDDTTQRLKSSRNLQWMFITRKQYHTVELGRQQQSTPANMLGRSHLVLKFLFTVKRSEQNQQRSRQSDNEVASAVRIGVFSFFITNKIKSLLEKEIPAE